MTIVDPTLPILDVRTIDRHFLTSVTEFSARSFHSLVLKHQDPVMSSSRERHPLILLSIAFQQHLIMVHLAETIHRHHNGDVV